MKKYLCSMGAWVALTALTASGQTSSSGGGQSTSDSPQTTTSDPQRTTPGSQGATSQSATPDPQGNQQNLPPGLQNRDQLPPGLQNRDQLPPGLAKRTNSVSNLGATNQNQFGDSSRFGTNSSSLYPTGRGADTNRTYGTNFNRGSSSYGTNSNPSSGQRDSYGANNRDSRTQHRDEAVTAQDRTLLINIRQTVQTQVRSIVSAQGAWAPINFRCDRGVVTILGTVQSIEIKQQIIECVRRVSGVVRVEDTIVVAETGSPGVGVVGASDQVIITRVREQVLPQVRVSGIDFQCHDGVVTVIGSVPQPELKERLITLVREVPGVVNVTDQVSVTTEVQGQARFGQPHQIREGEPVQTRLGQPQQTREGQPVQTREGLSEQDRAVSAGVETSRTNLPPTGRDSSPRFETNDRLPPPGLLRSNNTAQPRP